MTGTRGEKRDLKCELALRKEKKVDRDRDRQSVQTSRQIVASCTQKEV